MQNHDKLSLQLLNSFNYLYFNFYPIFKLFPTLFVSDKQELCSNCDQSLPVALFGPNFVTGDSKRVEAWRIYKKIQYNIMWHNSPV